MKKIGLLLVVLLLAACSDSGKSEWVAQTISKEEKEPAPVYETEVAIHTPISTTTGLVIQQKERDKWILVNAEEVSGHPNVLVHEKLLTLGKVEAIDVEHNIAVIHIRNSYDFKVEEALSTFKTIVNGEEKIASVQQIKALLQQAIDKPITWQERFEKNEAIQQNTTLESVTNFTTYYEKNIFTYNADELKMMATNFIEALNNSIKQQDWTKLQSTIGSDEMLEEIKFVTKLVKGYEVREAKKEGVYYFVNGVDANKKDVRLTFIHEKGQFLLIGTNLIDSEAIKDEKIAVVDLSEAKPLAELPALQMFLNQRLSEIKIKLPEHEWHLKKSDKKIEVTQNEKSTFTCDSAELKGKDVVLNGCGDAKKGYIIAKIQ